MNLHEVLSRVRDPLPWLKAGIYAGFSFFTTLAGVGVAQVRVDPGGAMLAGSIAAGIAFFTILLKEFRV